MLIPKIIHTTWKTREVMNSKSPLIENGIKKLIDLNPDWEFRLYIDEDIEKYLFDHLGEYEYDLIKDEHIVPKCDIWRLMKLYTEGGIYIDIDRYCNVKLDEVIRPETKCVLPISNNFDFSHDIMISSPGNPIYMTAFQFNIISRSNGNKNVYFLGPQTYMHAITKVLTDRIIDTNPGIGVMNSLKQHISALNFMQTYVEFSPTNTFLYRNGDNPELEDWEGHKRSLYSEFGMKHWTGEW